MKTWFFGKKASLVPSVDFVARFRRPVELPKVKHLPGFVKAVPLGSRHTVSKEVQDWSAIKALIETPKAGIGEDDADLVLIDGEEDEVCDDEVIKEDDDDVHDGNDSLDELVILTRTIISALAIR
jgi:hypothetical protein